MNATRPVQLIAVVGGSGAGKGWLVNRLCRLLGDKACHLQLDDFYRDRSHLPPGRRARLNFDIPDAIDWEWAERVLRDCRAAQPTRLPRYDFATHSRLADRAPWQPRPLVLVDGLWLLRPAAVRALFDLRIFLDTPANLRCSRRLARDIAERGYSAEAVERQLRTHVVPMHDRYVEPQKKRADIVLTQPFQTPELVALADRLWAMLMRGGLVPPWMHETFRAELIELLTWRDEPTFDFVLRCSAAASTGRPPAAPADPSRAPGAPMLSV
jgi:uridine kinase